MRDQTLTLFWPSTSTDVWSNCDGTLSLGSAGLPVTSASAAASGASGLAENSTGTTTWLAAIVGASTLTPGGQLVDRRRSARRRSRRDCRRIRIACRFPLGTATDITPVPSGICSALVVMVELRHDRRDLDPVRVIRPSLAELVDQPDDVLGVLRGLEAEVAVGPDRVVGPQHRARPLLAQIHHRIERRANPAGITVNVVRPGPWSP